MPILALCLALLPPSETPLSDQITKIAKDFEALEKHFHDELVAARHDDKRVSEANRVYQADWAKAAEGLIKLVKAHQDDSAALNGLLVLTGAMRWTLDDELTQFALKRSDDPKMGELCFNLRYRGGEPWATRIVEEVAEHNPSPAVRAQATFCRGDQYRDEAFPWGRAVSEELRAPIVVKARESFSRAVKDGKGVKTPDGKADIADKAKHELARLDNMPSLKVGGTAPEIEGVAVDGSPLKLSDHRGKVTVVVFWGSWCGPCMAMVPHERELWKKYQGKPFALLGVNCGDDRETAGKTMAAKEMTWPSYWDGEEIRGPIETDYDIQHWPTVFVLDAKGVIRYFDIEGKELEEAVGALLKEMGS